MAEYRSLTVSACSRALSALFREMHSKKCLSHLITSTVKSRAIDIIKSLLSMIFSPCVKLMIGWSRPDRVAQGENFSKVI